LLATNISLCEIITQIVLNHKLNSSGAICHVPYVICHMSCAICHVPQSGQTLQTTGQERFLLSFLNFAEERILIALKIRFSSRHFLQHNWKYSAAD